MGKKFADSLVEGKKDKLTAALIGELGAGKTTFVQGFAEGLSIEGRIISPTFIIMRKYEVPKNGVKRFDSFYHVDLYRIEEDAYEEVKNLGVEDIWGKPGNIVFVEWAEKIADIIPDDSYEIDFEILDDTERRITIVTNDG